MSEFTFLNGRQALVEMARHVVTHGDLVSPRGEPTREILNANITIMDPHDCLAVGVKRKVATRFAAVEALQLIAGISLPELTIEINPNMAQFTNEVRDEYTNRPRRVFWGAYGPRISDQMPHVAFKLRKDPDTRQALVNIWQGDKDHSTDLRDVPCTLSLQWMIRNDRLWAFTTMRSNDVWWGFTYDMFMFTQVQLTLANVLEIEAGPYVHNAKSFHAYERDIDGIEQLNYDDTVAHVLLHPAGIPGHSWPAVAKTAEDILLGAWKPAADAEERWWYDKIHVG